MPSTELVCTAATPVSYQLPGPTGRIVLTIIANPALVVATADGTAPNLPSTAENPTEGVFLAGVLGEQAVLQPPLYGDHMVAPIVWLASLGIPTVLLRW